MMLRVWFKVVYLGVTLSTPGVALAQAAQHWSANSMTAISITGDITLSPTRITFQNGTSLDLSFVGEVSGFDLSLGEFSYGRPVREYRITRPKNVRLLRGNHLCGPKVPTYLLVYEGSYLNLAVLSGNDTLTKAGFQSRLCGTFSYAPA
jgi:hypothetical protein